MSCFEDLTWVLIRMMMMGEYYMIEYEIKDHEDMNPKTFISPIKLHKQIENGEIVEWIIGDA